MNEWVSCKKELPRENLIVWARNPFHEDFSWINGKNELGKPRWFHFNWVHADDFVTDWRLVNG